MSLDFPRGRPLKKGYVFDAKKCRRRREKAKPRGGEPRGDGSIHHPSKGCRRFRCPCGIVHTWISPGVAKLEGVEPWRGGTRVPDLHRRLTCECGILHTR